MSKSNNYLHEFMGAVIKQYNFDEEDQKKLKDIFLNPKPQVNSWDLFDEFKALLDKYEGVNHG